MDETFDMEKEVRKQVNDLSLEEFFSDLAELLVAPPKPEDDEMVSCMKEIGLVPGQPFDHHELPMLGHKLDPKLALLELVRAVRRTEPVNGWFYWTSKASQYGTDYERRAMDTLIGPGLSFPQDAMYPFSETDIEGSTTLVPSMTTSCGSGRGTCSRSKGYRLRPCTTPTSSSCRTRSTATA